MSRKESTKFMMRSYIHKIFTPTNDHVFVKDCFIIIHRNKLVLNHNWKDYTFGRGGGGLKKSIPEIYVLHWIYLTSQH